MFGFKEIWYKEIGMKRKIKKFVRREDKKKKNVEISRIPTKGSCKFFSFAFLFTYFIFKKFYGVSIVNLHK